MRTVASGLVLAAVWLVGGTASAAGKVVINEFLPNPAGVDDGKEWIELYNAGDAPVTLTGFKVQSATSAPNFTARATVTAGTVLAPGQYWVIGGASVATANQTDLANGAFGNAGSGGDCVRLVDGGGAVIDTVVYGEETDGFNDDSGQPAATSAPKPGNDDVLSRVPNGSDTNSSGVDFVLTDGTLGANNGGGAPPVDGGVTDGGSDGGETDAGEEDASASSSSSGSSGSSSSSGSSGTSSGGKSSSSSSGGKSSSSSGGKADGGKTSSSSGSKGTSSGGDGDDDDDSATPTDDGGCNTGPGGSLPLGAVLGTGVLALLMRRRRST